MHWAPDSVPSFLAERSSVAPDVSVDGLYSRLQPWVDLGGGDVRGADTRGGHRLGAGTFDEATTEVELAQRSLDRLLGHRPSGEDPDDERRGGAGEGDQADLAARQAEIIADIFRWSGGSRILVCPTYYSFDPVLEKHFGAMPDNYWQTLGRELPREVDILWTGNRVCSDTVTMADIELINAQVGRPVMLWDNYPVNDGAVRSKFLYCDKAAGREPGLDEARGR